MTTRWGILSTGQIARHFTEDLLRMPDAEVLAVGSRSQEAADRFATELAVPRAYGSWQALADSINYKLNKERQKAKGKNQKAKGDAGEYDLEEAVA